MGAATHPITDAIWREALAPELALTVNGRIGMDIAADKRRAGAGALARVVVARAGPEHATRPL